MSDSKTALSVCEAQDFHVSMQSKPAKDNKHINSVSFCMVVLLLLTFLKLYQACPV